MCRLNDDYIILLHTGILQKHMFNKGSKIKSQQMIINNQGSNYFCNQSGMFYISVWLSRMLLKGVQIYFTYQFCMKTLSYTL